MASPRIFLGRFFLGMLGAAAIPLAASAQVDEEPLMGWTFTPDISEEPAEDESELDRLSRSSSGVTFGLEVYAGRSDNPLEPVSVTLRALDKVTATYKDLVVPIGEPAAFGPLTLLPRTCDKRPPEEFPETTVFLEVYSTELDVQGRGGRSANQERRRRSAASRQGGQEPEGTPVFRGWMFASSPSLNALEHPVYDVWVIDCKMVDPAI